MDYLKVWATPRLSRKREIYEFVSEDQVKRGEWVEEENGNVIKHYRRTVRKSIQEEMDVLQKMFKISFCYFKLAQYWLLFAKH